MSSKSAVLSPPLERSKACCGLRSVTSPNLRVGLPQAASFVFFARSFGAFMAACAYSHFTDGPSAAVVKYMAVAGALMMPQWALCTMDDEGHNTLLWKIHTPVQLGMIALLGKAGGLF